MFPFRRAIRHLLNRYPVLQKLSGVGWKVVLTETLIEIPFLILESSALMRLLFGFTLGLTLWQYVGVATLLYLLLEVGRWAFVCYVRRSKDYRVLDNERSLLQLIWKGITQLRQKIKGEQVSQSAHPQEIQK
jgi:hypothetical protein